MVEKFMEGKVWVLVGAGLAPAQISLPKKTGLTPAQISLPKRQGLPLPKMSYS